MKIIDLDEAHQDLYLLCLEDWSEEIKEAGDHKAKWYEKYRDKGLIVKLALDDQGEVGGMIQCLPIEESNVEGKDLYFILCIWVHGYKKGRGNFQKMGMGKALLEAAETEARARGKKGMAAWGLWLPFWMKASWFKKQGYRKADRASVALLVWKAFTNDATPPRWLKPKGKPERLPGKVTVTGFINGWCPAQNLIFERARRASETFGDAVHFQAIDTSDRQTLLEWGISDEVFINGKKVSAGPPPSYDKIYKRIAKEVRKL